MTIGNVWALLTSSCLMDVSFLQKPESRGLTIGFINLLKESNTSPLLLILTAPISITSLCPLGGRPIQHVASKS